MQSIFSHFCCPLSLLPEFFYIPISPPTPSSSPHLLLGLRRGKERWKKRGAGSAKLGSALAIHCPTNLLLFPCCWAGGSGSQAAQCHCPPDNALPPPGQSSLTKPSRASLTLYQVPQGWQRLLLRHQPHSAHWRAEAATEGCQARHVQAAEAARKRQLYATEAGGTISRTSHWLCMVSPNVRTWHRKEVTGTCSRWFSFNRGSLYGLEVVKETNHTGSRKTNKRWTGAKNDLALPVTLQFISSASWEANTRIFFFSCFTRVTLQRSWKMTKYRGGRKQPKQHRVRGWAH